jgi:hypothetical protein
VTIVIDDGAKMWRMQLLQKPTRNLMPKLYSIAKQPKAASDLLGGGCELQHMHEADVLRYCTALNCSVGELKSSITLFSNHNQK